MATPSVHRFGHFQRTPVSAFYAKGVFMSQVAIPMSRDHFKSVWFCAPDVVQGPQACQYSRLPVGTRIQSYFYLVIPNGAQIEIIAPS